MPVLLEKAFIRAGLQPPPVVRLWARRALLPPLAKAYLEINYALERLGRRPVPTDTPSERAELLGQELPLARKPARKLVHEYQVETFSNQSANLAVAVKSAIEIKDLSIKSFFKSLFSRLQRQPKGQKNR